MKLDNFDTHIEAKREQIFKINLDTRLSDEEKIKLINQIKASIDKSYSFRLGILNRKQRIEARQARKEYELLLSR